MCPLCSSLTHTTASVGLSSLPVVSVDNYSARWSNAAHRDVSSPTARWDLIYSSLNGIYTYMSTDINLFIIPPDRQTKTDKLIIGKEDPPPLSAVCSMSPSFFSLTESERVVRFRENDPHPDWITELMFAQCLSLFLSMPSECSLEKCPACPWSW